MYPLCGNRTGEPDTERLFSVDVVGGNPYIRLILYGVACSPLGARSTLTFKLPAMNSRIVILCLLILTLACAGAAAGAQNDGGYTLSLSNLPSSYTLSLRPESDTSSIVLVRDGHGRRVRDLDKTHFAVKRDGRDGRIVKVVPLEKDNNIDLRVVLVIDNSKSMKPRLEKVLADMDSLMAELNDDAEISVVSFNLQQMILNGQKLNVRTTPFLRNKEKVRQIYTEIMRNKMTHSTYLYDAVYAASAILKEKPTMVRGREIRTYVILLSDGKDIGSEVSATEALNQVYTGGNAPVFFTIDYFRQSNTFLKSLAQKTGGKYYAEKKSDDFAELLAAIACNTYSSGYRVIFNWKNPPVITVTDVPATVTVTQTSINEAFPLLTYVFFGENSASIPDRYKRLSADETAEFDYTMLRPEALTYYYNMLNIIGRRMREMPQATITITGCNAHTDSEQNNTELSRRRADSVAAYLTAVWGISPGRIVVESRNLPAVPSRNTDEAARSENRRVEISSDTWDIIKPVLFKNTTYEGHGSDSISVIRALVGAPGGVRECRGRLLHDTTVIWEGAAHDITAPALTLVWEDICTRYAPANGDTLTFILEAVSRSGDTAIERRSIVPVVTTAAGAIRSTRDKISLLLFDFNKAEINAYNIRIMKEFVYPHLKSGSTVVVKGYTDNVGNPEVNINLSEKRAIAIGTAIRSTAPVQQLRMHGLGELSPLFSNTLPEGRFYNRTVVVLIDSPVE